MRRAVLILAAVALAGCSAGGVNPSLPLEVGDARALLRDMQADPRPLERPVVVLGGIHDPGFVADRLARNLRRLSDGTVITTISFGGTATFDGCRDRVISRIEQRLGPSSDGMTVEVDVVAFSMGGLVARHAARPRDDGGTRLRMRRLFTISAPHRGARMAGLPTLDKRVIDMRPGSAFLAALDADLERADYELYPYTRLGDLVVGAENAAPPGRTAWWVSNPALSLAHMGAAHDPRIVADIARRLRGEQPVAAARPAPIEKEPLHGSTGRPSA